MRCLGPNVILALITVFVPPVLSHAQTGVSVIAAVTPANTNNCVAYGNARFDGNPNDYSGYCEVPVSWHAPMPGPLYAITCAPETGPAAGYLYSPQIYGNSRSTTGFTMGIFFARHSSYTLADLGTMYVDCIASNQ